MFNTSKLAGRTLFVTGAGRKIGTNIDIASKTTQLRHKFSVEDAHGKCLRSDLMPNIDKRGIFLTSKYHSPHSMEVTNSHTLNPSHKCTMAKSKMTEFMEVRDVPCKCDEPEIVSDSAYVIQTRDNRLLTSNFCVDEDIIKHVGRNNFANCANKLGATLMLDLLLNVSFRLGNEKKTYEVKSYSTAASGGGKVLRVLKGFEAILDEVIVKEMNVSILFKLSGAEAGDYYIDMKSGKGKVGKGKCPSGEPDVTFEMESNDFIRLIKGTLKPVKAVLSGKMKVSGEKENVQKFNRLLIELRPKLF